MKKSKILYSVLFALLLFAFSPVAFAADLSVTCDSGGCDISGDEPLFDEDNVYPGWSVTKTVKAKNEYGENREFMVEVDDLDTSDELSKVLKVVIREDGDTDNIFGPVSLEDWENEKDLPLTYIDEGNSTTYEFIISMDTSVGNYYQGKSTEFDLKLGFDTLPEVEGVSDESGSSLFGTGGSLFAFAGQTQGIGDEDVKQETPAVEGAQDDSEVQGDSKCVDPWWWFLVFVAQIAIHIIIHLAVDEEKKFFKLILQILNGALFVLVFWENFCPAWDYIVAGVIGLIFSTLSFTKDSRKY